jgi:hypothetical protein
MSARQGDLRTAPLPFLLLALVAGNAGAQEATLQTQSNVVTGLPSLFEVCAQPSDFVRHQEYNPACQIGQCPAIMGLGFTAPIIQDNI